MKDYKTFLKRIIRFSPRILLFSLLLPWQLVSNPSPANALGEKLESQWWDGARPVSQDFGCTTSTLEYPSSSCSTGYYHSGIDIGWGQECSGPGVTLHAPEKIKILSIGGSETGFGPNYPTILLPDHNGNFPDQGGFTVILGHVTNPFGRKAGDILNAGDAIAGVNNLGNTDHNGCHLHFEVRPRGGTWTSAVDPKPFLNPALRPGGWWINQTPTSGSTILPGGQIMISAHAEDNNNNGLSMVNLTVWNPSAGESWHSMNPPVTINPGTSNTDVTAYYNVPSSTRDLYISFDVYSRNGLYQKAPQGIRKVCAYSGTCNTSDVPQVLMSYTGGGIGGGYVPPSGQQSCSPGINQVALFVDPNYSGQCVVKDIGGYPDPSSIGLPNDSISSVKIGGGINVQMCRDNNFSNTCEWTTLDIPDLSTHNVGTDQISSIYVQGGYAQSGGCSPGPNQVSLFVDTNFGGQCINKEFGTYNDPGAIGLPNDSISSLKVGSSAKIQACRDNNLSNTCEWIEQDVPDLGTHSVGSDQISSAKVFLRGSITLCDGAGFNGNCRVFSDGTTNLADYGWANRVQSVQFNGAYDHRYHIVLWTGPNQTGNPYHADSSVTDLGPSHDRLVQSINIYPHVAPNAPSNPTPSDATILSNSTSKVQLLWNGADQNQIHVWGPNYDLQQTWMNGNSLSVTGLQPGRYYWQVQSQNDMGPGPWSDIWSFVVNSIPQVDSNSLSVQEGQSASLIVKSHDPDDQVLTLTANNLPSFASFTDNHDGTGTLRLNPVSGSAGSYNVTVQASDGSATGSGNISLTVTPSQNMTVFDNFSSGTASWWNGGNTAAAQNGGVNVLRFTPPANSSAEAAKNVGSAALANYDTVKVKLDLHGATLLGNDASALYLDQGGWKYVSLSNYVQQGLNGFQIVSIPVSDFSGFIKAASFDRLGLRFWTPSASTIDIGEIDFVSSSGSGGGNPPGSVQLLQSPWHLTAQSDAAELYQGGLSPTVLQGKTTMRITYDLHGLQALGNDASAIIFDQGGWHYVSLSDYGQNGKNGSQTVDIPLSAFSGLNLSSPIDDTVHIRFWYGSPYAIDITSILVF